MFYAFLCACFATAKYGNVAAQGFIKPQHPVLEPLGFPQSPALESGVRVRFLFHGITFSNPYNSDNPSESLMKTHTFLRLFSVGGYEQGALCKSDH